MMDFMEFSRDTTRFRREAQYLPKKKLSTCELCILIRVTPQKWKALSGLQFKLMQTILIIH